MNEEIKICVDKLSEKARNPYKPGAEAATVTQLKWEPGKTIRIKFLNGDPQIKEKVKEKANLWMNDANLKFEYVGDGEADIRIGFKEIDPVTQKPDTGSWSYLGMDALTIPKNKATMNFGWLEQDTSDEEYERVVCHEFGHALAYIHEHQHPLLEADWNKEEVYKFFMGPPNNWKKEDVDNNLFARYDKSITQYTQFDRQSIMLYNLPGRFFKNGQPLGTRNTKLSDKDKEHARNMYPR